MTPIIKPLGARVLVKRVAKETKVGSIHIPENAQDKSQEGEVVGLGVGLNKEGVEVSTLFTVKVGDRILLPKYGGTEVRHLGEDLLIVNETDIIGVLA